MKIRHTAKQKQLLSNQGFQFVSSSNVSAIAHDDKDLIIRFHNGSVYTYPNRAKQYDSLLKASSHGKWVWKYLRRSNAAFKKTGTIPFKSDKNITDDELFANIDKFRLDEVLGVEYITITKDKNTGLTFKNLLIAGLMIKLLVIDEEELDTEA